MNTDERQAVVSAVMATERLIAALRAIRDTGVLTELQIAREQGNVALAAVNRALGERSQ